MRWTMSSATLTTISRPVPPRNAVICQRNVHASWLTAVGITAMTHRNAAPT